MKKINVSEATNTQLNWLVARCEEVLDEDIYPRHSYSSDPSEMWPIIHREVISVYSPSGEPTFGWVAMRGRVHQWGSDGLVAAARCYVVSELGQTVEVPEELT